MDLWIYDLVSIQLFLIYLIYINKLSVTINDL